jgi:predicted DNA-binding protein (MmcQ/YjbR family)
MLPRLPFDRYPFGVQPDPFHERLLAIVKSLPGAFEDRPWGSVHCKVAGKIFVGWGRQDDGGMSIGFKTDKELQTMLVSSDPRFTVAAYVGKHGWVDMKPGPAPNWGEVEQFILQSYRMIAPRKLVKELDGRGVAVAAPAPRTTSKPATVKKPAKVRATPTKAATSRKRAAR